MALLRIRKPNGEIVEIASLPGAKGENGKDGKDGKNGTDGYTPVKGVDYFTPAEQESFIGAAKDYVDEKIVSATCETYGVVRVADDADMASITGGIYPDKSCYDRLSIVPAKEDQIDGRYGCGTVITPLNLEYAVKSVGDGYYAKVGEAGGEKEYELINTITVTPDTDGTLPQYVIFSTDIEGNPFELSDFHVVMRAGFTDGTKSTLYCDIKDTIYNVYQYIAVNIGVGFTSDLRGCNLFYSMFDGLRFVGVTGSSASANHYDPSGTFAKSQFLPSKSKMTENIREIRLFTLLGDNKTWIDGSTFELWGVRK